MVIDGAIMALLANVPDELLHHLLIGRADCARIGNDLQIRRFQILEQDIAFKGQVEFGLIEHVKDDDVIALEAKMAQSFKYRVWIIEQVGNQNDQPAPLYLAGDLFENLTDIGIAARTALFQRMDSSSDLMVSRLFSAR